MRARILLSTALLMSVASAARAQTPPMGSEIPVNNYTTNVQDIRAGAVAVDQGSNFGIVWESFGQDGDGNGVYGGVFGADGSAGSQGRVNTFTSGNQSRPVVGADKKGDFVVAWQSEGEDGSGYGIYAQRYANTGFPIGGEFRVNTTTAGSQTLAAVAMNRAGRFVIVWSSSGQDGDGEGVFGQIYDDNGAAVGGEFQVNTYTTADQTRPAVAMSPSGDFVVVWESAGQDGDGFGVIARRFDPAGNPTTAEIPVNTFTTGDQRLATVGMDRLNNFVVAWESAGSDGSATGVSARRFDSSGSPLTGEFQVNTYTTDFQGSPSLGMDRNGNFVVAWESVGQDGDGAGIYARAFNAACTPSSPEFPVNVTTTGDQQYPSLALSNRGEFVVGWQSTFPDANGNIVARVSGPRAQPMFVDAHAASGTSSNLNGVLEPGETVQLEPRYRDLLTFPIPLTGTASNLTGPPGPTYTLNDSTADYGTIAAGGGTNNCFPATGNCYVATVSGARPTPHWDATFDELLSTGITKTWTLHVGESFPDVPTSQQFYFFIEDLFHNGITGGCGGGNYCPTGSVTRGQMAVFLLKSEHDAFYTPPPCTGVFPDVPCPSQFADWIEQLFAEGITGGCGGGNYCPDSPVTRAQMAVFLLKAEHGASFIPPACTGIFLDVPCPSTFANWIEQLAAEMITGGCGGGNYCPNNPNNRGQMAVFLDKTFGFALYGP